MTNDEPSYGSITIRQINDRFDAFFGKCADVAEVTIFPIFDLLVNVMLSLSIVALACLIFVLFMVIIL